MRFIGRVWECLGCKAYRVLGSKDYKNIVTGALRAFLGIHST